MRALRFFLKSFYFFFNRVARYTQSKESRNLPKKIPQITYKAIFRNCLKTVVHVLIANSEGEYDGQIAFAQYNTFVQYKNRQPPIFLY